MATFKFRAKDLLIYSHLRTNESNFLQSFVRTWIGIYAYYLCIEKRGKQ